MVGTFGERKVTRDTPKFAIFHGPTGSVHTYSEETNFIESVCYTEDSEYIKYNEETFYKIIDMWPSDMILYDSKEEAEEKIEYLLENDSFIIDGGDTREDFTIVTMANITVSGLALQFS